MDLATFFSLPAPRPGGDEFLAAGRERSRRSWRPLLLLFVPVALIMLGSLAFMGSSDDVRVGGTLLACLVFMLLVIGLPAWLHGRQDVSVGRRLLRDGVLVSGKVTDLELSLSANVPHLRVAWERDGVAQSLDFRVPISVELARTLVGVSVPVVYLPGVPSQVAIALPGQGLITTR